MGRIEGQKPVNLGLPTGPEAAKKTGKMKEGFSIARLVEKFEKLVDHLQAGRWSPAAIKASNKECEILRDEMKIATDKSLELFSTKTENKEKIESDRSARKEIDVKITFMLKLVGSKKGKEYDSLRRNLTNLQYTNNEQIKTNDETLKKIMEREIANRATLSPAEATPPRERVITLGANEADSGKAQKTSDIPTEREVSHPAIREVKADDSGKSAIKKGPLSDRTLVRFFKERHEQQKQRALGQPVFVERDKFEATEHKGLQRPTDENKAAAQSRAELLRKADEENVTKTRNELYESVATKLQRAHRENVAAESGTLVKPMREEYQTALAKDKIRAELRSAMASLREGIPALMREAQKPGVLDPHDHDYLTDLVKGVSKMNRAELLTCAATVKEMITKAHDAFNLPIGEELSEALDALDLHVATINKKGTEVERADFFEELPNVEQATKSTTREARVKAYEEREEKRKTRLAEVEKESGAVVTGTGKKEKLQKAMTKDEESRKQRHRPLHEVVSKEPFTLAGSSPLERFKKLKMQADLVKAGIIGEDRIKPEDARKAILTVMDIYTQWPESGTEAEKHLIEQILYQAAHVIKDNHWNKLIAATGHKALREDVIAAFVQSRKTQEDRIQNADLFKELPNVEETTTLTRREIRTEARESLIKNIPLVIDAAREWKIVDGTRVMDRFPVGFQQNLDQLWGREELKSYDNARLVKAAKWINKMIDNANIVDVEGSDLHKLREELKAAIATLSNK